MKGLLVAVAAVFLAGLSGLVGTAFAYQENVNGCVIRPHTSCPGADLSHADLSNAPLAHANLAGANLSHAYVRYANLDGANLDGANLTHAHFIHANLSAAGLRNADLRNANFEDADLRGAHAHQVTAGGTIFRGADMSQINLFGSQLEGANLRATKLAGASAQSVNFAGADLLTAYLDGADLRSSNFVNANVEGSVFTNASLEHTQFRGARFAHTRFQGANVTGMNLSDSNVASDPTARGEIFMYVNTHVNAYDGYGSCEDAPGTSRYRGGLICSGQNDVQGATYGLDGAVSFSFGPQNGTNLRPFEIHGSSAHLEGESSWNLGAFYVAHGHGFLGSNGSFRSHTWGAVGEVGGPLAVHIGAAGLFGNGYVMGVRGWVQREGKLR